MLRRIRTDLLGIFLSATALVCVDAKASGSGDTACLLKFGVVSDIHLCIDCPRESARREEPKKEAALEKLLRWYDAEGVDAVLVTGDIADYGKSSEFLKMREIWNRVFPGDRGSDGRPVERLFITGNHERLAKDYEGYYNETARDRVWRKAFDEPYEDVRVKTVKGYDFILCGWGHCDKPEGAKRFEEALSRCGASGRLFFQAQHQPPAGTCHGGTSGDVDNGVAGALMSKYPNCVSFSGHTHQVLNDERAVWQRAFTSIGASSLSCTYVSGGDYPPFGFENGPAGHRRGVDLAPGSVDVIQGNKCMGHEVGKASFRARQAMLVCVYDGAMEIRRRDINFDEDVGPSWKVPYPAQVDGPFDPERRPSLFDVPEFPEGAELTAKAGTVALRSGMSGPGWILTVPGGAVTKGGALTAYKVGYVRKGKRQHLYYASVLDYNQPPAHRKNKETLKVSGAHMPLDVDEVFVEPLDCFGRSGKALTVKLPKEK